MRLDMTKKRDFIGYLPCWHVYSADQWHKSDISRGKNCKFVGKTGDLSRRQIPSKDDGARGRIGDFASDVLDELPDVLVQLVRPMWLVSSLKCGQSELMLAVRTCTV